jgi:serralysin
MSTDYNPEALYCAFTNGYGVGHRDPETQMRCAVAAIEDNPENEPNPTAVSLTEDFLAAHTDLHDTEIQRAGLILNVSRRWKNGRTIRVGFIDGPEWAREQVLEIAQRWTKYANLELVLETNLSAAEIRVGLRSGGGSWSMLGNGALGVRTGQTMHLGWYVNNPGDGVVLHEFGHGVIAAPHEQFHPGRHCTYNRQAVIRGLSGPPNHWSLAQIETNVLRPPWQGDTFTRYDRDSIMHYAQPAHWFTNPDCAVAPNHTLSRLDKKGAARFYPKPTMQAAIDGVVKMQEFGS